VVETVEYAGLPDGSVPQEDHFPPMNFRHNLTSLSDLKFFNPPELVLRRWWDFRVCLPEGRPKSSQRSDQKADLLGGSLQHSTIRGRLAAGVSWFICSIVDRMRSIPRQFVGNMWPFEKGSVVFGAISGEETTAPSKTAQIVMIQLCLQRALVTCCLAKQHFVGNTYSRADCVISVVSWRIFVEISSRRDRDTETEGRP
jgi:hypothetical protein